MRLIKTLVEPIASLEFSYTPFPLEYERDSVYVLWEARRLIEFRYEAN